MTTKHELLHSRTEEAILELSDTKRSVRLPLVTGKAPGKLELVYQLFPPPKVRRHETHVYFTFVPKDEFIFKLGLTTTLIHVGGNDDLILGYISDRQVADMAVAAKMKVSGIHYAAVKYSTVTREGFIFISNEIHSVIGTLMEKGLIDDCGSEIRLD